MVTNIYVTLEEAGQYIEQYKGSSGASAWAALDEVDQKANLFNSMLIIDRLPFIGRKASETQTEAFPRVIDGKDIGIPEHIKLAIAFQALCMISASDAEVSSLRGSGVANYSIDDFSVSFANVDDFTINPLAGVCDEALGLLAPYLMLGGAMYIYE
ncbi:MAG: DnaT-like ssDNA-binding protein [Saccharofermentanales bacterium]